MKFFSVSKNILANKLNINYLLSILFALSLLTFNGQLTFAQSNSNTNTYYDNSPGARGSLFVTTETLSEDLGRVTIKGSFTYSTPPQPKGITFTLKNLDGKGSFAGSMDIKTSYTPDSIDIVFDNFPLDKSSKTKTLATKDRLLLTSSVDTGVDYFFSKNNTFLSFNSFQAGSSTNLPPIVVPPVVIISPTPLARTTSLTILSSKLIGSSKTKASVDIAAFTLLPDNHYDPVYIGISRAKNTTLTDYTVGQWRPVQDPDAPRTDGMVLGVSRHSFDFELGESYLTRVWASNNSNTKPVDPNKKVSDPAKYYTDGEDSGVFLLNADYLFGKKVSNTAPQLVPVDQAAIDSAWDSLTGTFIPGDIEFFKVGSSARLKQGSDDAYIFLSKIPGIANTTVTREVSLVEGGPKEYVTYDAFDPKIEGSFSKYVSTFINMVYGFIALLAVINIVYYGIKLMASGATPFIKKESNDRIWNSFIALAVALGSYLLLNTINPNLTNWNVGVTKIRLDGKEVVIATEGSQARIADMDKNDPNYQKFSRTNYYDKIKVWSAGSGVHHCVFQVSIQRESKGVPGLIGHDENVRSVGIKSRRDFINLKTTYNKKAVIGSINDLSAKNDDKLNTADKFLGLDWRFSHSVGLFGLTFFPKGSAHGDYSKGIFSESLNKTLFPKDIYSNQEADAKLYVDLVKNIYKSCGNNVLSTYKYLSSGSCSGNNQFTNTEAPLRADLYKQCIAQDK